MTAHPKMRHALGVALIALAAASIYMSWGALYEFAIACGIPAERAIVFPAVIDVVTVVAMLVALQIRPESRTTAVYPWLALLLFGAVTIAGNAMHVITSPARLNVPVWVAVSANAMPAIALMVTTHLAAVTVYRRRPAPDVEPAAAEAPATPPASREDLRARVLELAAQNMGPREIERETGVSRSTVSRWLRTAPEPVTA